MLVKSLFFLKPQRCCPTILFALFFNVYVRRQVFCQLSSHIPLSLVYFTLELQVSKGVVFLAPDFLRWVYIDAPVNISSHITFLPLFNNPFASFHFLYLWLFVFYASIFLHFPYFVPVLSVVQIICPHLAIR